MTKEELKKDAKEALAKRGKERKGVAYGKTSIHTL